MLYVRYRKEVGSVFIKDTIDTYRGLPRSVYIIFLARVINCIGNFVFPLMTLLLTVKIGMSAQQVGFFLLLSAVTRVPASLLGGKLADHMGRKKIMIIFMGLAALCFVPCAFLGNSMVVPVLLIVSSFFNGVSGPAAGAMMNDLTIPENRQASFSLLYLGINVGTAVGSVVSGLMFNDFMQYLFLGDAATTFIAIILLIKYVDETRPTKEDIERGLEGRADEKAEKGGLFSALLRRPVLLIFALLDTIYSFTYAQTHFSLPLQAKEVFGQTLGPMYFGTFNMVNCLEVIGFTTLITTITRKVKDIYNVSIAGIFFAVGFGMLFFVRSFWLFILSTIIWTIGEIINATNVGVYIANHTPISHRGRFSAIIDIISGTGYAVAPYIMGGFIAQNSVANVWPIIFVMAMSAALGMFLLGLSEKRKSAARETAEVECQ